MTYDMNDYKDVLACTYLFMYNYFRKCYISAEVIRLDIRGKDSNFIFTLLLGLQ